MKTANIVCFKHKHYRGSDTPLLSCGTCCSIYINLLKEKRDQRLEEIRSETSTWLEQKRQQAMTGNSDVQPKTARLNLVPKITGFDPAAI